MSGDDANLADGRERYDALCRTVASCRRCPTMEGRRRVLSSANGQPGAPVMFVAEAPGRLGAEISGVPLSGDRAGRRFELLLRAAGWERGEVFVTNAVLCNPRTADGRRNRPPSDSELRACRDHLAAQIEVVDPLVVVSLGTVALKALGRLHFHGLRLGEAAGRPWPWNRRWLFPMYHPGDRALIRRSEQVQVADAIRLGRFVRLVMAGASGDC
jgi:uracil-DNA glycosylase family 4